MLKLKIFHYLLIALFQHKLKQINVSLSFKNKKKDNRNCACHCMVPNCLLKMLERTPKLNFTNDQVVGYDTRRSPPSKKKEKKRNT